MNPELVERLQTSGLFQNLSPPLQTALFLGGSTLPWLWTFYAGTIALLGNSRPGIGLAKLLDVIGWLIACGAVVFLWRRPSSAFFNSRASISR